MCMIPTLKSLQNIIHKNYFGQKYILLINEEKEERLKNISVISRNLQVLDF